MTKNTKETKTEQSVENQTQSLNSDKLRNMPVGKLLFGMALPAIISMLIESLYNIVDSVFVAQYDNAALDAIGIARPIIMIIISTAIGIGVGANAYVARQLGFGDREKANQVAKTAMILAAVAGLLFFALSWFIATPFAKLFTSDAKVIGFVAEYLPLYMAFSIFSMLSITGSKILQATGNMRVPMISQILGCVTNIVLDPLFIFEEFWGVQGLGLGMKGAIIATAIGQFVSCVYVLGAFVFRKQDVDILPRNLKFSFKNVGEICNIGLPTFILNAIGSFTTMILNGILKNYENGITILSVYFTCQSFVFMPTFGLTQGTLPVLSYNFGANLRQRFNRCFKLSVLTALCFLGVGFVIFQACPQIVAPLFNLTGDALTSTVKAFRTISISFIPAAFSILTITLLQSLNAGMYSMFMSLLRQLGLLVPLAFLFNSLWGIKGVFFCYPAAEFITLAIFAPIAYNKYKKTFEQRELQDAELN